MKKEIRALAPVWVGCLAVLAAAALLDSGFARGLQVLIYCLGPIALGALSMGHEYTSRTLSLLLSQPIRRERIFLRKLAVLASMCVILMAAGLLCGVRAGAEWRAVYVAPLLCGLVVAPWLTMLTSNPLAGMVFSVVTGGIVVGVADLARNVGISLNQALWSGMLFVSAVAAISGWRVFMRLEAIDGRGQILQLPSRWTQTSAAAAPSFAARHAVWLLTKKELRLQLLAFVISALYVVAWFAIWFTRAVLPGAYLGLLSAAAAINVFAVSVLAGSLASAEERQLGTIEWQVLQPMSGRRQWIVKVAVVLSVAVVLGMGVPMALIFLTGSQTVSTSMYPLVSFGVLLAMVFLSAISLYISSVCTSGPQAVVWSVAAGFLLMAFSSQWIGFFRLGFDPGFDPFLWLRGSGVAVWKELSGRVFAALLILSALGILMYAGGLAVILRFARTNHGLAERGIQRVLRQLLGVGAYFAVMVLLCSGMSRIFRAEAEAFNRAYANSHFAYLDVAVVDRADTPTRNYTVVLIPEAQLWPNGYPRLPYRIESTDPFSFAPGRRRRLVTPGRYSAVAVEKLGNLGVADGSVRDPELIARLKAQATPFTLAAGESKTLKLIISSY